MPIPLIVAGISAGVSMYGAHKQAAANKDAIKAQTASNDKALAFETQRYADATSRLRPYVGAGQNATARMAALLGLPETYTPPAGDVAADNRQRADLDPITHPPSHGFFPALRQAQAGGVALRAPTGEIEHVPADQVAHYLQQGAVRA